MTHQSILMQIKLHYNQITFTEIEDLNFHIFDQKLCSKTFWKGKIIKTPAGFESMTYRLIVYGLTHCATR